MIVKIKCSKDRKFSIMPITEDEVLICDMGYLCGFDSYEEAEDYCIKNNLEIEK